VTKNERDIRLNEIVKLVVWLESYRDERLTFAATHVMCNYFDLGNPGEQLGLIKE